MMDVEQAVAVDGACACAFPLPWDARCAARARALLVSTMEKLGLPPGLVENGELAVSELATNAHLHADRVHSVVAPELWVWIRSRPAPQLVVSVFDADRTALPHLARAGLLEENGKGLDIVAAVSACWGSHPSRCRLGEMPVAGKVTWFALSLLGLRRVAHRIVAPSAAADALTAALAARGIHGRCRSDDKGISVVQVSGLNVWVEPQSFAWHERDGGYIRHPLVDLHEVAEQVVRIHEEADPLGSRPLSHVQGRRLM